MKTIGSKSTANLGLLSATASLIFLFSSPLFADENSPQLIIQESSVVSQTLTPATSRALQNLEGLAEEPLLELKNIGSSMVLPNTLTNILDQTNPANNLYVTCNHEGNVAGPRIRLRKTELNWKGPGNYLPLMLKFTISSDKLASKYTFVLAPVSTTTISHFFGQATDYIPEGLGPVSNELSGNPGTRRGSRCYFDASNVPAPKVPLKGTETLTVHGTLEVIGVQQTENSERSLNATADIEIIYSTGSLPLSIK